MGLFWLCVKDVEFNYAKAFFFSFFFCWFKGENAKLSHLIPKSESDILGWYDQSFDLWFLLLSMCKSFFFFSFHWGFWATNERFFLGFDFKRFSAYFIVWYTWSRLPNKRRSLFKFKFNQQQKNISKHPFHTHTQKKGLNLNLYYFISLSFNWNLIDAIR